jgi:hypothetical protein
VCNLTAMGLHAMEQGQKNKWNYIAIVLFFLLGLSSTCHVILFHTCMTCLYPRNFWVTCNYTYVCILVWSDLCFEKPEIIVAVVTVMNWVF